MISELSSNIDSLRQHYIFANTPAFLYNHFREDSGIKQNSQKYSSYELLKAFFTILKRGVQTHDDLLLLYAITVSLTYKEHNEVRRFFRKLLLYDGIPWFKELSAIYFESLVSTKVNEKRFVWPPYRDTPDDRTKGIGQTASTLHIINRDNEVGND